MDAIRKKMQSLKTETENLYKTIKSLEDEARNSEEIASRCDSDIRDISKRISILEADFDATNDKLVATNARLEEREKTLKQTEEEVNSMSRRQALMEEEDKKSDSALADTVIKLAIMSKNADGILKKVKYYESKTMRNEVEIEEMDKTVRETKKMAHDSEQKLDEMTRRLGVQEEECRRAIQRAEAADLKILELEEELNNVGENMKQLEISAEKAQVREEKLKEQIRALIAKFKAAEARYEYGEMNITKLNHRIDDLEDDIYREKLKIKRVSDELNSTFDDMLTNY
jgi:tropomyosin 1